MKYIFILISLKLINAKINIDIKTGTNNSDISINYSGIDTKVISHHEVQQFNIDRHNLNRALKMYYGRTPNNVYLKSPTPWGDLYNTYKWEPVKRVLSITSARVKGISRKPVLVTSQDFDNAFNTSIKVNAGISQTVENTVTTTWSTNKEIEISQEIEYDVNILFGKFSGTTGFSYTSSWGVSEEKTETVTIGTTSAVELELKPGQSATAVLNANRGFLEIEVVYMATLRGNLAVNFNKAHNGHHFWGPPIEKVMKKGNIENKLITKQTIKIGFYSDASLKVFDKFSGKPL